MQRAEFVIIGSGQGGVPLAAALAEKGHRVVIFERAAWGGTCVNTGCIPSKTLLASAHAAAAARNAGALGVHAEVKVSFEEVMNRVRDSIHPEGIVERLNSAGAELIEAEAEFVGARTVRVGKTTVEADTVIINTGKSPFIPDIPGLSDTPYLTYKNFWELKTLPEKMVVIGGGYTGLELAQAMQRLGSQVDVVEVAERLVAEEEEAVSQALQQGLEADGVRFHLGANVEKVAYKENLFEVVVDTAVSPLTSNAPT